MRESLGKCGLSKAIGGRGIAVAAKLSLPFCNVYDTIRFCDATIAWSDMLPKSLAHMIEKATDHM